MVNRAMMIQKLSGSVKGAVRKFNRKSVLGINGTFRASKFAGMVAQIMKAIMLRSGSPVLFFAMRKKAFHVMKDNWRKSVLHPNVPRAGADVCSVFQSLCSGFADSFFK